MDWPVDDEARFHRINYQDMLQIRAMLQHAGWATRSINRAQVAIRNIVKIAVMMKLADSEQLSQLSTLSQLKHAEYPGTALTQKQVQALFTLLERSRTETGIRNIAMFAVLLGTGLRRSELVALELKDFDANKQTLLVRNGKGNKSRTVFLPDWSLNHLKNWLTLRSRQPGYLFCPVQANGKVKLTTGLSVWLVLRLVKTKLQRIGVENASPHDLRRTFITRLLEQNVDLNTVRQMAGHASITTTTIYDKRDMQFMQQAARSLSYGSSNGNSGR
ncbi:site-specific integrase [Rheinheimera sp. SM2107]|uniref:Site-specific integrase n=2 Tax=Arsukibacterium indicum TaxID=2848612 RepID=A0ABS6MK09_9GAMM|nr:site-specific integrase [Arsukibacterium indicum]